MILSANGLRMIYGSSLFEFLQANPSLPNLLQTCFGNNMFCCIIIQIVRIRHSSFILRNKSYTWYMCSQYDVETHNIHSSPFSGLHRFGDAWGQLLDCGFCWVQLVLYKLCRYWTHVPGYHFLCKTASCLRQKDERIFEVLVLTKSLITRHKLKVFRHNLNLV